VCVFGEGNRRTSQLQRCAVPVAVRLNNEVKCQQDKFIPAVAERIGVTKCHRMRLWRMRMHCHRHLHSHQPKPI